MMTTDTSTTGAPTVYTNGRIFTAGEPAWAEAMVVAGAHITFTGDTTAAVAFAGPDAAQVDLRGHLVLPGFVDAHAHVVGTGEAAAQADLWGAGDLDEIGRRIRAWSDAHPDAPRVLAQGWIHSAIPGGEPTRAQLDAIVGDRPAYAQAYDYHSIWLNSAALAELGIVSADQAPAGGRIAVDTDGRPTGLVDETAMQQLVWPRLDAFVGPDERDGFLRTALRGYREKGVTASTDMALGELEYETLVRAEAAGTLTARISAYWRIEHYATATDNLAQVARAAQVAAVSRSPMLRVVGIKVFVDGTVDGCTAALGHPYADGSVVGPIWSQDELDAVVAAADAAGLDVAMHAIGDEAVRIAIGAVEHASAVNAPRERRHRIEHLEVVTPDEIERIARLGIVASMQPVHADPAIQGNWRSMLGDERAECGFPWSEVTAAGARLAFGTDSPTSPFPPLPNMFVASTRRSALNPALPANTPRFAVPLTEAIVHATRDAAWACRAESMFGTLTPSRFADFVVLDRDVLDDGLLAADPEALLQARVLCTVLGGDAVNIADGAAGWLASV